MLESIAIIIPIHKEPDSLLISTIHNVLGSKMLNKYEVQIIVSKNGTSRKIELREERANVRIIHSHIAGLGIALRRAIKKTNCDFVYFLPVDNPFRMTDINRMIEERNNYDLILGSKLHQHSRYKTKIIRVVLSYIQLIMSRILFSCPIKDPNGSFFGRTTKLIKIINQVQSQDFFFQYEMVYLSWINRYKILEIPVTYECKSITSNVKLGSTLQYLLEILRFKKRLMSKNAS